MKIQTKRWASLFMAILMLITSAPLVAKADPVTLPVITIDVDSSSLKELVVGEEMDLAGLKLTATDVNGQKAHWEIKDTDPKIVQGDEVTYQTVMPLLVNEGDVATTDVITKLTVDKVVAKQGVVAIKFYDDADTQIAVPVNLPYEGTEPTPGQPQPPAVTEVEKAAAKAFFDQAKVVFEGGKAYLEIQPIVNGLKAAVVAKEVGQTKEVTLVANDKVQKTLIADVKGTTSYQIHVVVEREDGVEVLESVKVVQKDLSQAKPVINYAYVIDGALIINSTSEAGMAAVPVFWKYSYEPEFRAISSDHGYGYNYYPDKNKAPNFDELFGKTTYNKYERLHPNDYRIPVEIPCKIQLVFVDAIDNKTPVVLDINRDNYILKGAGIGTAPAYVEDLIKSVVSGGSFEAVREDDLLVIQENTTVNLFDAFKGKLQDAWKYFNSRELEWTCNEMSSFDPFNIKFDRAGRYVFDITKEDSAKVVQVTVLVMEGKNNIKSFKIVKDPQASGDTFKAIDAFEFATTDRSDANPIGFYAKFDGNYYRLVDEIPFATAKNKDNKVAEIVVRDVMNNKNYKITFTKTGPTRIPVEQAKNMFADIKGHWAESRIVTLIANGVIQGYPDGTFKPENKISVRETLAIVGRYARTLESSKVNAIVHDKVNYQKANWGNNDVEFVLRRLPVNIFEGVNLDTAISREQVAYVMAHIFKYPVTASQGSLTDVATSRYANEVGRLIAAGSIQGYPDKTFKPTAPITRAELCSMMFVIPGVEYNIVVPVVTVNQSTTVDNVSDLKKLFE